MGVCGGAHCVWVLAGGRPSRGIYPTRTSLALSGKRSGTKLNGAAKGATLLQLISLSTDVSQGPYGVYVPARARLLAETEKAVGQKEESVSELLLDWLGCWLRLKKQHGRKRRVWASCFWLGLFARTKKACIGCP